MAAGARFSENTDELARLEPQIQEREEALPLRERVKNIFKKYGWTLQAVALAVGVVFSALALAGLNGLKAGTKAVGQGLKTIGQKLGSLLPGLIGSIVRFIFKAAGQVFSFLAEHAWLLILAVVAAGVADCAAGCASPWASVARLCTGFEGWLFGGLILLFPPAICFRLAFFVF